MFTTRRVMALTMFMVFRSAAGVAAQTTEPAGSAPPPEYLKLVREFETCIAANQLAAAREIIDEDFPVRKALLGIETPPEFVTGFTKGARGTDGMLAKLFAEVQGGASYKFLRMEPAGPNFTAVFRLVLAKGGVNYHRWTFTTAPGGGHKFGDLFIATAGENLSALYRRGAVLALARLKSPGQFGLEGSAASLLRCADQYERLADASVKGDFARVLTLYDALPADLKGDKKAALMRVTAALQLQKQQPQVYLDTLDDFQRHFPNDCAFPLLSIDVLELSGKYDEAFKSMKTFEANFGSDPYMLALEAVALKLEKGPENLREAEKLARQAIKQEPTLKLAYEVLLDTLVIDTQYSDATEVIDAMRTQLGIVMTAEKVPEWADFVKSPEYHRWKAAKAMRRPGQAEPGQ